MINSKKYFPIFENNKNLIYFDNASTTQMPQMVIDEVNGYNAEYKSNIHRGSYKISELATKKYEEAREKIAKFINAEAKEIIFVSGTTYGLNSLAYALGQNLRKKDNVVVTRMEHHSNLIPWQMMSKKYGFEVRFIELQTDFNLDIDSAKKVIDKNTKIVSFTHVSNTLGTINPVEELSYLAKKVGAISIIDGAQSVAHMKIDVKKIACDFFVFSGHKIGGPTGTGIIYGKKERLENLEPFIFGGGMISSVKYNEASWAEIPAKFEAGTPNIAGVIGLGKAVEFLQNIGMEKIEQYEKQLTDYALSSLSKIKQLKIIGPLKNRAGVISFAIDGIHPHDVATLLDRENIAVRSGYHCTEPLMKLLKVNGTTRVSLWFYNDKKEIDKLVIGIKKVIKLFNQKLPTLKKGD